jgi:sugar phosphate permease
MPSELEKRVMRKISLRIVPFIMLLYFIAFIDRVNIGFAALTMNKDLGFSPAVFGLGAGIFFIGYFLFEVPSNLILNKVGARPVDRAGDDHVGHHFCDVRLHHGGVDLPPLALLARRC